MTILAQVKSKRSLKGSFGTFILAIAIALCFRSLLFEPFRIPSGSMKSTLLVGDYIIVDKHYYGYSKYSFPFSFPLFEGRIASYRTPQAGDVIVFRPPRQPQVNYIKRVIGIPGDSIKIENGQLYINNIKMHYERIDDFIDIDQRGNKNTIVRFQETLYNGRSYEVLDEVENSSLDNTPVYTVPEGHVFVLGDNRDNSRDSRFIIDIGYIPIENIVGKACVVALSFQKKFTEGSMIPFKLRYDRIWHIIK